MSVENNQQYLLALHSSTQNFGVAILNLKNPEHKIQSSIFDLDVKLSNNLFRYIDTLIPRKDWKKISRLAVATGPGSFTGTRISITMARTLAQQINCEVDGISNFSLMAPRLSKNLCSDYQDKPFWIMQSLKNRGNIAGKYQLIHKEGTSKIETLELEEPCLLKSGQRVNPAIKAMEDVSLDINELIKRCLDSFINKKKSPWQNIVPIYPTSPVL